MLFQYELIPNSETYDYNCISHTIGLNNIPSWPTNKDYYWPVKRELTKETFDEFYQYHGFEKLNLLDITYHKKFIKVALYMSDNKPTHAAIQCDSRWWESKIGSFGIIKHDLFEIEEGDYGKVIQIYRKPSNLFEKLKYIKKLDEFFNRV